MLLAALLLVGVAFGDGFVVPAAHAQSLDPVLVSNTGQAEGTPLATTAARNALAQSFTTGSDPDGYDLTSVQLGLAAASGVGVEVSLWSSRLQTTTAGVSLPNGEAVNPYVHGPNRRILNLAGPSAIDNDTATLETFSASEVLLYPNMTYWVVVRQTSGAAGGLKVATALTAGTIDAASQAGFTLGGRGWAHRITGDWWPGPHGRNDALNASMRIRVGGVEPDLPPWGPYVSNRDLQRWADSARTGSSATRYATSFRPSRGASFPGDFIIETDLSDANRFQLTSVLLSVAAEPGVTPRVAIHANASGSPADSPLTNGTLTAPAEVSRTLGSPARAVFTASSPITLSLNSTYWVVLDVGSGSGELSVGTTSSNDNDAYRHLIDWDPSLWKIGDSMKEFDGTTWSEDSKGRTFRMAVNGTTDLYTAFLTVHPPQVGLGTVANIETRAQRIRNASWQWQRGETRDGTFTDISAAQGGTAAAYVPVAADLGKWLKATVSYTNAFGEVTLSAVSRQPVLSRALVSNTGLFRSLTYFVENPDHSKSTNLAQALTTGSLADGYVLRGLRLGFEDLSPDGFTVVWSLHADDGGIPSATPLFNPLDKPRDELDADELTLEDLPHPGFQLTPDTRYWVVITFKPLDPSGSAVVALSTFASHGEKVELHDAYGFDPGSATDWEFNVPVLASFEEPAQQAWFGWENALAVDGYNVLRMSVLADRRVVASFTQTSYDVAESDDALTDGQRENEVTVTVTLSTDPKKTTTIPIARTERSGATDEDYSGVPDELVFAPGETSKEFTVTIEDDSHYEYGEVLKLSFGDLPDTVIPGDHDAATIRIGDDDRLAVSFAQQQYTVAESDDSGTDESAENEVIVTVELSADPEREVVVPITATNQGGASDADYSGVPSSVTFESGETSKTFTLRATHDTVDDDGESVLLGFGALPADVTKGSTDETTVSITDDDDPSVTVSFGASSYTVAESDDSGTDETTENEVIVTVELSADPERSVTIPIVATNQGGASDSDYSGVPSSVTFASGETSKTFTFRATADDTDDDGESVLLGFGALPADVTKGSTDETTVSITDDDDPSVTVSFGSASYTVAESDDSGTDETTENEVIVTVELSADPEREVIVPIVATNQGGATAADYSGVPASVTFASGETSKTFTFRATADDVDDDGESVKLSFGALPGGITATSGEADETTVAITDDDDPSVTVSFGASSYTVAESDNTGTSGMTENEVIVTVELSADPEREVVVPITATNQGGASDADYSGVPSSVTFESGETSKTFTLRATHDTVDDDGESVLLGFGALPADVTKGSTDETTVAITDDDDPSVTVSFGASSYTVAESDDSGTDETTENEVIVTVELSADPERSVTIPIVATNQGGASDSDYSGVPSSVTFASGETRKTFTFRATADDTDDDGESAKLSFGTLPAGVTKGSPDETTVSITDDDVPGSLTVSFGAANYTVAESGNRTITVQLDTDPERSVIVPISITNEGGVSDSDYSGVPTSVTFNSGDTSKTFIISAVEDNLAESGEKVKLSFGTLPSEVSTGTPSETTVTITDRTQGQDLPIPPTVHFGSASYAAAEGATATVTVELSKAPGSMVVIPITATNQGGASDADYSELPSSVTFAGGDTRKTFTFTATADDTDDDGESVKLSFGALPGGITATSGEADETTVAITDDDDPSVTVSFGASSYTVAESDNTGTSGMTENEVIVTVELSADPEREVVVPITATNQGGASDADYSGVPSSVTFASGDTSKTFTFRATADDTDDDGESVLLGFGSSLPAGVTKGSPDETTVSITDDDDPAVTVSFGSASYTVAEGGNQVITVTLSADPERSVTIPLTTTNQGGASDSDYSGVPSSVTFASGETRKTFTFTATADDVDDDGESVKLSFGTLPVGVTKGSTDETTVSITDDDDPSVTVSFGAGSYTVAEGGNQVITVTLSADPERSVTIPLTTTNQGGASAADYSGVPSSVTFASGETRKTFTFRATADDVDDDGESVKLSFGTPPAGVTKGSTDETTVSITDDDDPSVTVSFGASSYTVAESDNTGTSGMTENEVIVTVELSADPERTVIVPITATNQGGASDADYSGVPASVTFASGETSKTFTFTATADDVDDDGESVKLSFGALPTDVTKGSTDETTVTITDDDDPSVTVSFGASSYTVAESDDSGTDEMTENEVIVTVELSADPERSVTIPIVATNQGGATAADYSGVPASVTFASGETSKTFTFRATADDIDDDGESVLLGFGSSLPAGVTKGSTDETMVSITDDDDPAVTVSFGAGSYTVAESDDSGTDETTENEVIVTVELSADPEREVIVPIVATNQDGATAADYSGVPASVTFASGETSKTFTFRATADDVDDDGESVKLSFGTLPAGVTKGSTDETTVSITDDDDPAVTVSFGAGSYTVAESDDSGTDETTENEVIVTVELSADPERSVTVPIVATNQDGASAADYSGVPSSVTFASGETSKTFTFTATADDIDDDGESVKLGFGSSLPAGVTKGSTDETTVSITDDDDPAVTVSFGAGSYTVAEGGNQVITVTLSADPERSVTIPLTTTNQGGASAADYSGVPSSVTFASGETRKTFTFRATADDVDDDGESVKLSFGTPPAGVTKGSTDETTVSITDDDDPSVTVSFGSASYTVAESDDSGTDETTENEVIVTVELSADPEREVIVPITATNQGGASDADYSGVPSSVTFASGETRKTFTFRATADDVDDDGESVLLGFGSSLPAGVTKGSPDETMVSITDDDDPAVTVSFGAGSYTVAESDDSGTDETTENEVIVTVELSADPERSVTVPIVATNQDGATAADYSGVPASVTFASGETSKTFTFTATADDVDDDGESVKLSFGTLPAGVTKGSTDETTVSITDDDDPSVTVSFGAGSYIVAEGGNQVITVTLSADPERTVIVPITATNQGGASDSDYSGVPSSVTFASGETSKTFTFTATADDVDDDGESVKLSFGALPTGVTKGSTDETTVTITDDDDPSVTVSFGAGSYTVAEGGNQVITVTLSADPERSVTIPLTTTNQGGVSDSDYSGVPSSVTFASGETRKTFTFTATADDVDDDGESVKLSFGALPTGVTKGSTDETTVTITDDDDPSVTVSFGASSYTVAESDNTGTSGMTENELIVTVTLSADPERSVTIPLTTTNQGGASAADYSGVPSSVTFASGETRKTFTFRATADDTDDDGESVKLGFGTLPAGVTKGSPDEATVSITDDDVPGSLTVSFGAANYTVAESGNRTITVQLDTDPERSVIVPISITNEGGVSDSDYSGVPTSVTFNSGDTSKTFIISAVEDNLAESGEKVKLSFGTLPSEVSTGTPSETTVTITDRTQGQDLPIPPTVHFGSASYAAAEGATATVTVELSKAPGSTVIVPITATNQGGASDSDYSELPSSVTFAGGDTRKTFTFTATADDTDDDGESVKLSFGALPGGITATSGEADETTVSITDDDDPSVTVSFGAGSYTVAEGGNQVITVTLSADPERSVTIPLTTTNQGGATAADYSGVPASVTFASGETSKTFTFTATADDVDDDGESVKLGFGSSLPAGVTKGSPDETTVSITDDDDPSVTVSFGASSYTVAESDDSGTDETTENEVIVTVELSADPEREVIVPIVATNQDGASAADYSGVPSSVTFASGETSKTFTFRATADDTDDDGESVLLGFGSSLPAGVTKGSPDETTVSITDDDAPSVTVSFGASSYTVAEGGNQVITVTLSADPERSVTIPLTTTNQGGASDADYSGVPSSVTFASGETRKTFTFRATHDTVDDDGESVKLSFGTLPAGVTKGSTDETTVSITDDDDPAVTVSFGAGSYTVAESDDSGTDETTENEVIVTVELSADPERSVTIPLTTTNQGGASDSDYSGVPSSVTFASGDTSKTFTFTATADDVDDDGESVKLGFGSSLPAGVTKGSTDETTVSITDDDDPSVTVSFGASSYTVAESDNTGTSGMTENELIVTVTLSADPERSVTIPLTTTNQGGASDSDYSGVPSSVTFASGETRKTFTFRATHDTVDDDGESVKLGFGTPPAGVTKGSTDETTVAITDDDDPSVTVSFGASSYTVAEGGNQVITVTLSADPERSVTIPLTTTNQGGATAADYSGVPSSVTFASGETRKTFTFRATADDVDDDGESVKLSFGTLPVGVTKGSTDETTVTITDDDDPSVTVSFGASSYTVAESDDSGTDETTENEVIVTVELSADAEREVVVPIVATNQGGATAADYSGVPASVTFASGETSKTFTFRATADDTDDDGESVKLSFGTLPAGVTKGSTDETTVSITDDDDPSVTVSFGASSYTVAESDNTGTSGMTENEVIVTVELTADPERSVTVPIVATNQGGASAADYSGVPSSVTFASGETRKTFTFRATADDVDDDGESVKLSFGTPPAGVTKGSTDETTVAITDDDDPSVTVSFGAGSYTVAESDDSGTDETTENEVIVAVELSADAEREVVVPIVATNQDGATAADYSGVPASVTFASGETSKTFTFRATADDVDDDGESVKLSFGAPPAGVTKGSTDETTVTITDDDDPSVTVSFGSASYTVAESGNQVITVTLSADPERSVTIPLTTTNQDGASDADYSGVPSSVTFASGETRKTFTFRATADDVDDDGESVKLSFGTPPAGVTKGSTDETTVTITDDDDPAVTVSFGAGSYTVAEGGNQVITVTLSADPERSVTIPLTTTNQGGASDSDYSGVPSSVTFASGDTSKTFTFTATADDIDDDGESVLLGFGSSLPAGVTKGSTDETTVSITDDDDPSVTVSFGASSYTVAESDNTGTSGMTENEVIVTVELSADPERSVTVPIVATNQGGATAADYSGVPASVTFASGETRKTFTFRATADDIDDDGESVLLGFGSSLPAGVTKGSTDETTVSITDDDDPSVTVSFGAWSYTVAESDNTGTSGMRENEVIVTVTLSADPERSVTIPLTTTNQGGATAADYSGVPSSVTFASGETSKTFTFTATADDVDDDGESVKLSFGTLPAGVTKGSTDETTVSITDDDDPSVTVSFGSASYTVAESDDSGTDETTENEVIVTVELSADAEREVVVPITATNQGGATAADYSGVPSSVTFASGETRKTFTFRATADDVDDDGESVKLSFGTPPAGVTKGSTDETTVAITDDDDPSVTVSFGSASYTVAESDDSGTDETTENEVIVTVELSADPEREVIVPITATNQGGVSDSDYSGVPSSVTFASGETRKTFTFRATHDTVDDDGESVKLSFGTLPAGVTKGSTDETTVTITDDDDPSVTVSFGASSYTVAEGGNQVITVTLNADPERSVIVPITATNQGGASAADYSRVPSSVTFASGETRKTFTFRATHDTADDDGESVKLGFGSSLPAGVTKGSPDETTVAITDDDDPQSNMDVDRSLFNGALRLMDGVTYTEDGRLCDGRVEIYYNGTWGTICDDYWNRTNVDVACRALGFVGGASGHEAILLNRDTRFMRAHEYNEYLRLGICPEEACGAAANQGVFYESYFGSGSEDILLDDVRCRGTEAGLLQCPRNQGEFNCSLSETAGLRCLKEAPPRVVYIAISDPSGGNGRYDAGETVEVTLVWSVPVVVTTPMGKLPPKVWVGFGDNDTGVAPYLRGSGTTHTVFSYTLSSGPYDDIRIMRDTLREREGRIRSADLGLPAVLRHEGHPDIIEKALPAEIVTAPIIRGPDARDTWGPGDTIEVTFNFNLPAQVEITHGTPSVAIYLGGTAERAASYSHGSGSTQVVFSYTLTEADGTHDAVLVQPNSLKLNGGAIIDVYFRRNVRLGHPGGAQVLPLLGFLPSVQAARVDGATLTLTYNENLDTGVTLPLTAFAVQVNESPRSISAVEVSGSNVTLTLTSAVTSGDSVTVDYVHPSGPDFIRDTRGRRAVSFSGLVVVNNTPSSSNQISQENNPATGGPGITGDGQTLTADTSGIEDKDGLSDPGFTYQWIRHDFGSGTDTDIAGATHPTYTVTSEDEGKAIKVRVTFTDDAGNQESLTSYAVAVAPPLVIPDEEVVNNPAAGKPTVSGTAQVGETLTADTSAITDDDGLSNVSFAYQWLVDDADITAATGSTYVVAPEDEGKAIKVRVTFTDDAGNEESLESFSFVVSPPPTPREDEENNPPTGEPYVNGTATTGQTLIVDILDIADEDGLTTAAFSYQWVRHDLATGTDTDIEGETGETYTVTTLDEGKAIRVRVDFADDAGNEESLLSAATDAVIAAPEPGLKLSDFDTGDGQEVLAKALIEVGDRGRKNDETQDRAWYAMDTSDWHASGVLLDGSLAWNGVTVNRVVYFPDAGVFRFNDAKDAFDLGESFEEGGVNRELTIWIQTETERVSFAAKDHIVNHGGHWINFRVPDEVKAVLDGIAIDDLIIVAVSAPDTS